MSIVAIESSKFFFKSSPRLCFHITCDFHYGNSFKFSFLGFNFQAFVCDKKSKKQVVIIVYDFSILNTQMSCDGYFFLT